MKPPAASPAEIEPFHAFAVSHLAHALKAEGQPVVHMEFGQPSTGAPRAAIAAAHRVLDSDAMGYWESAPLKARLARHYQETYGVEVASGRFIHTSGASPALVLALSAAFSPGDRIALARPGYVAYRNVLKALHMTPVEIGCGPQVGYQLTVTLTGPRCGLIGMALNRRHSDFSDEDRELLNLLRPHIGQAAAIGMLLSEPSPLAPLTQEGTPLLTPRQSRVVQLVSAGYDDQSIGRLLGISPRTVHTHLQHVYRALGVTSRTEALAQLRMSA